MREAVARVSFNFLDRCNMRCEFCYIPFNGKGSGLEEWKGISNRLAQLGARSITFGGGDPFMYPEFIQLLRYIRASLPQIDFIHVDTNGIGVKDELLEELPQLIDLLGLPLDGVNVDSQRKMRGSKSSFTRVSRLIGNLHSKMSVKINTVVAAQNYDEIPTIGEFLSRYNIACWSLYEFWPIGHIAQANERRFILRDGQFDDLIERIKNEKADMLSRLRIEAGNVDSRRESYFFVSNSGLCYTVDRADPRGYIHLGSVFDDDIIEKWRQHGSVQLNHSRLMRRIEIVHHRNNSI